MSYTYSGNPNSSLTDQVHYLMGNTTPNDPVATDEEVQLELSRWNNNPYLAAAAVLDTKALVLALRPVEIRRADRWTRWADPVAAYRLAAQQLRMQAALSAGGASAYAGGIDRGDKEVNTRDRSLVTPAVSKDLHTRHPQPAERTGDDSWAREDF